MRVLKKYSSIFAYIRGMGLNWVLFRIKYLYWQKSNYFDKINTQILQKSKTLKKDQLFIPKIEWINKKFKGSSKLLERADQALVGKVYAFSHTYLDYSDKGNIAWNRNPVTHKTADANASWNHLPDFGEYGDIKLIWEASRFPQIYAFINAYAITKDETYAKACLAQILDWIEKNPFPLGVNYKCGQEITFRVIAWMVAVDYFRDFLSKEEEAKIAENIYISLLRVDANIDYAARAVRNNHSLSEALGLIIFGLYFQQFEEAEPFLKKGITYLLQESAYQVYDDGSYIQHSFTYERLALDVLSFALLITDRTGDSLPEIIRKRHQKMIDFLLSFIRENGWLPNYGSNDGANLFPVDGSDYRDFRNSLNFAQMVNTGEKLFDTHCALADFFALKCKQHRKIQKRTAFEEGGYYIVQNRDIFSFIRCHSYKDRPASNDMFHVDVWHKGKNIFCDAGSYSYNTDKTFKNIFIGVQGHNTVMINDSDQMEQVLNFGYAHWTKAQKISHSENYFSGINLAYQKRFGIAHKRTVTLEEDTVLIVDKIKHITEHTSIKQIWNTTYPVETIDEYTLKVENCILSSTSPYKLEKSYISDYYNTYHEGTRIIFMLAAENDCQIKTTMEFLG